VTTRVWRGAPYPLGATWDGAGVNFALFSENATAVDLCLFDDAGAENANGAYGTAPTLPASQLTGAGAEFRDGFQDSIGADENIQVYTLYAATATQVLLDAISRSDGTRADIIAKVFDANLSDTATGQMSFNEDGDPAAGTEQLFKANGAASKWEWSKSLEVDVND